MKYILFLLVALIPAISGYLVGVIYNGVNVHDWPPDFAKVLFAFGTYLALPIYIGLLVNNESR